MDLEHLISSIEQNNSLLKENNALLKEIKSYIENPERLNEQVAANVIGNALYIALFNNSDNQNKDVNNKL